MFFSRRAALCILLSLGLAAPAAQAALDIGDKAPDFSTVAARAGKQSQFSLSAALAKGPVALYL